MGVGVVVLAMVFTGFSFLWFLFLSKMSHENPVHVGGEEVNP